MYSSDAWEILRAEGVVAATSADVFGRNIDELMRRFGQALSATTPTTESLKNIEESLVLAEGTVAAEGLLGNLKGALFELVVAFGFRAARFRHDPAETFKEARYRRVLRD